MASPAIFKDPIWDTAEVTRATPPGCGGHRGLRPRGRDPSNGPRPTSDSGQGPPARDGKDLCCHLHDRSSRVQCLINRLASTWVSGAGRIVP